MRNGSRSPRPHAPGLLLLGACTLWLVVQNTLLALVLLWLEPHKTLTLAALMLKAAIALISGFWTSPVAPLLIGALFVVGLVLPIVMSRATGREVIHG